MKIEKNAEMIINILANAGFEAYAVGGCVRDSLMGSIPKDWDIATSAKPKDVQQLFEKTYDTGLQHGTVTVLLNSICYEVTTFRIDGDYLDSRRPSAVTFSDDIIKDLQRRDFTINAMAYNNARGLIDPFNGQGDLRRKLIRAVGSAHERIQEDALRMLRAIRFSARFGFALEESTAAAIIENAKYIKNISGERIRDELVQLIASKEASAIFCPQARALLHYIDEAFEKVLGENEKTLTKRLCACEASFPLRLAILVHPMDEDSAIAFLKKLRLSNAEYHRIFKLYSLRNTSLTADYYSVAAALSKWGVETFEDNLKLAQAGCYAEAGECSNTESIKALYNTILDRGFPIFIKDLAVNGHHLQQKFGISGVQIGAVLEALLDFVHHDPKRNTPLSLLKYAESLIESPM